MAEFFRTDQGFIIQGPARILMAERALSTYVEQIGDVINKVSYDPVSPWFDVGHTAAPFELSSAFDTVAAESQQVGTIDMGVGDHTHIARTSFMEESETVREVMGMTKATENAAGERVQDMVNFDIVTEYRIAAIYLNTNTGKINADFIHKAQWSGAESRTAYGRGETKVRPVEWRCFPDDEVPNDAVYRHIWDP